MGVTCADCGQELDDGQHDKQKCVMIKSAKALETIKVESSDNRQIHKDLMDIKQLLVILINGTINSEETLTHAEIDFLIHLEDELEE